MSASLVRLRRCCCLCPQAYFFVCGYMLLRPFLPAYAPLLLPVGVENHTYFTL